MPRPLSVIGDRVFWRAVLARGCRVRHLPQESVAYRSLWRAHYEEVGESPPDGAQEIGSRVMAASVVAPSFAVGEVWGYSTPCLRPWHSV